jgi:acyl-CoA synthetase (AMP-forming)/AMP-acid ligase II
MLIHRFLREAAERRPEARFLTHRGAHASYGEVAVGAWRLARLLGELGLARGERVGLLVANSRLYVEAYYGVLAAGGIAVALHAGSDPRTLRRLLGDCGARALVAGPRVAPRVLEAAAGLPELRHLLLPEGEAEEAEVPSGLRLTPLGAAGELPDSPPDDGAVGETDRAMIVYTSGSTGHPRGAVLSHLNVAANTRSIVSYLDLRAEDRVSVVLPFPYVYGKSLLNTHAAVGGSLLLHDGMVFPNAVLDLSEKEEVTGFAGVPSTFAILLNRSDLARRRFPSLRYLTQAGGGMPVPHIRRLREAVPGARLFVMYGATEASARLSYLEPERLEDKTGSIGRAIPGVELTVRREDGSEADVGEPGEIVARGENIMEGYWGEPEATAEVLGPLGFHTGDLARRDEEGFLWLLGRKREMIKSGAHRVSPREIEEVLLESPEVDEVAVVGVPDEYLGEAIVAHLTARPGSSPSEEDLLELCRERLPAHKVPREVRLRGDLPRNPAGKIDKKALAAEG